VAAALGEGEYICYMSCSVISRSQVIKHTGPFLILNRAYCVLAIGIKKTRDEPNPNLERLLNCKWVHNMMTVLPCHAPQRALDGVALWRGVAGDAESAPRN